MDLPLKRVPLCYLHRMIYISGLQCVGGGGGRNPRSMNCCWHNEICCALERGRGRAATYQQNQLGRLKRVRLCTPSQTFLIGGFIVPWGFIGAGSEAIKADFEPICSNVLFQHRQTKVKRPRARTRRVLVRPANAVTRFPLSNRSLCQCHRRHYQTVLDGNNQI